MRSAVRASHSAATETSIVSQEFSDGRHPVLRGGIAVLTLTYALSYLDRQIINILAEPIKRELHLSDGQLGMLVGLSFAIFYTGFGLPIARLAERVNRSLLIAACLVLWSIFTALCGIAGTFLTLLAVRIGVGVGEAGCLPASQALIADYVPAERRASAMALLIAGSPIGILLGMALGGTVAQHLGWRAAFLIAALPGAPLALILMLTVRDPLRASPIVDRPVLPFVSAMYELLQNRAYLSMVVAAGLGAFASYAQAAFLASFLLRNYEKTLSEIGPMLGPSGFVGLTLGVIWGVGGFLGTLAGGRIADRLKAGVAGQMTVCIWSSVLLVPFLVSALLNSRLGGALALLLPCAVLNAGWAGPFYAAVVSTLAPGIRATAAAFALLLVNLIGLGAGPIIVGAISDALGHFYGPAEGLRWALVAISPVSLLSAGFFWIARSSVSRLTPDNSEGEGL